MQKFLIGPMCVTKEDFEKQLNSCGLKFGYIKRLYEKWKDGDLTYFRIILEGSPFVIVTDDENSYPEIQEETGKKVEPYSFEWLVDTVYNAELAGPVSYEVLLRQLQRYIQFQKARQNDERKEQENCPYCHPPYKGIGGGDEVYEKDGEGIFVKDGKIVALSDCGCIKFNEEIKLCPKCGRNLEA